MCIRDRLEPHPGVAEGVGLGAVEVEELGSALVVRAEQFAEDVWADWITLELDEAVTPEELGLERQAEHAAHAERARIGDQSIHDEPADPMAARLLSLIHI